MINLYHITDIDKLRKLFLKDELYKNILNISEEVLLTKDYWAKPFYIYEGTCDNQTAGVMVVQPFLDNCYFFHSGLYKEFRSLRSKYILSEALKIVKKIHNVKIITTIPKSNEKAIKLVKSIGFKEKTCLNNASSRGDILLFGED